MPTDVSTDFNEFVNKNTKPKLDKKKIKIDVLECLSNSVEKMSIYDISKSTGYKTDNVYVAIVESKETKSKNIDNVLYWYINENQIDPPKKIIAGVEHKKVDPLFIKIYEEDKKNSPNNRRIFLSPEEHQEYRLKHEKSVPVETIKRKTTGGSRRKR